MDMYIHISRSAHSVHHGGHIVVVGNLRGPRLTLYAEGVSQEFLGKSRPIDIGEGRTMCVEVACGTSEFT